MLITISILKKIIGINCTPFASEKALTYKAIGDNDRGIFIETHYLFKI